MSGLADRGKWAEKRVQGYLDLLNDALLPFCYERLPDARSARGAFKAMMCDFRVDCRGRAFALEVKETEHDFRLEKAKLPQLPKLRKARHAGVIGIVVVFHSTVKQWRAAPLDFFDGPLPPSWDLSPFPLFANPEEALLTILSWASTVYALSNWEEHRFLTKPKGKKPNAQPADPQ